MITLSIIVPIYNVEKYIDRCLANLVEQDIDNYEIVLVDDGSTDSSGTLADEYARHYKFINVIHQKNKGLSGARNTGMLLAEGKYIMFVDSDDWIDCNCIASLVNFIAKNDLDVCVADFREVHDNGKIIENKIKPIVCGKVMDGEDFFLESLRRNSSLKCVWKSIYKREFLIKENLFFKEGYNHEDEQWTPRVYLKAKKVQAFDFVFYNYYIREDSISKKSETFAKNSYDLISNCYDLKQLSFAVKNEELRKLFQNEICGLFLSAFYKGKLFDKKKYKLVDKRFFDSMFVYGKTREKKMLFCANKYIYYYVNKLSKIRL